MLVSMWWESPGRAERRPRALCGALQAAAAGGPARAPVLRYRLGNRPAGISAFRLRPAISALACSISGAKKRSFS